MNFDLNLEDINYIKILYKDRYNFSHYLKAAIQKLENKYIFAGVKSEKNINIDTPQEVVLSFISDNGLYRSKTTLNFVRFDEKEEYLFFSLITPKEVEYQQNREYFRVNLQGNARLIYKNKNEDVSILATIHDISANGVRLVFSEPVKIPEEENVTLDLFFPQKEISTSAKFIRTDEDDDQYKASFHFINLSTRDLDYISRLCLKKQLENKRHYRS